MSWYRRAFSITSLDPDTYYCSVSPLDFYEWKYMNTIPKGTVVSKYLPPSDMFVSGKIVVTAQLNKNQLKQNGNEFELIEDIDGCPSLKIGNMSTPREILAQYNRLVDSFNSGLNAFKKELPMKQYIHSHSNPPHLLKFSKEVNQEVVLINFGPIKDVVAKLAQVHKSLKNDTTKKLGRSFEMEVFKKFDNAMAFVNNSHLHVDHLKMDCLLKEAKIEVKEFSLTWNQCYIDTSKEAKSLSDQINMYRSKRWVSDTLNSRL